jgi:hypothetical protein
VSFVASDPSAVYEQYGDLEGAINRLIDPRVLSGVRTIFGQFDAARAIQMVPGSTLPFLNLLQPEPTRTGN